MDKKTILGLILMGLVLTVYTIVNQPTEAEIRAEKKKLEQKQQAKKASKKHSKKVQVTQGAVKTIPNDTVENKITAVGEIKRIENDKLIVEVNTRGGEVAAVYLKEYETYKEFSKKDKVVEPLALFKAGDASNEIILNLNGKKVSTRSYVFDVNQISKESIHLSAKLSNGGSIEQVYALKNGKYNLDYDVQFNGLAGKFNPKNVQLNWKASLRKTERLFSEQRRVSTVCFKNKSEDLDYLSEMSTDFKEAEHDMDWIAFKQSYFSSILKPDLGFTKTGSKLAVKNYDDGHQKKWTHLKDYTALATLALPQTSNPSIHFDWYFGPNDYATLQAYGSDYGDILNFGWGLFRWINIYAVQPIFDLFLNFGIGIGIAILLLTLVIKFVLMPIQWKMYLSSAKMRILKPEIDELNAKYPKQEDAMKKQMEMMTLYRESGASPLSGCIPMLIQMPILLAVFRFFPAAFELRQQPFLWAEDLSSYDSIWDFGVTIWPYGDHMSLFTLLMAATTLLYTFMNSGNVQQPQQPGMPNMKVIMYIFPIMMIFFFNNYSAGLSYYYFISTLISILIMLLIKQFFVDEEKLKVKMAERKASNAANPKERKKSKFQERLEQMQKLQQEQMKNRKR